MKDRVAPGHKSSSVESASGGVKVSFSNKCGRKSSTVVPTGTSLLESVNSQVSYEGSEVAYATVIVQVGSENAATSVENTGKLEISSENQSASSHVVTIPSAGSPHERLRYRFEMGDTVKYQNGKIAYTVRKLLGYGTFGEVYLVWSEVQQKLRAMKCSKFGGMSLEERRARFQPMCEEAFIMTELRHHPNIISVRFVKVSGLEFLVIMDLIHGSHELSKAYQSGSIWDPLLPERPSLKTISQTTSLLSLLWLQLAHAMDHLHSKGIMVCISCSFTFFYSFFFTVWILCVYMRLKILSN